MRNQISDPESSKMINALNKEKRYDFIVAGAGATGSVLAAELSASGAQTLVIESGGADDAPTIANPSIWFYNIGGPLDYSLPITPSLHIYLDPDYTGEGMRHGFDGVRTISDKFDKHP
jgi:choline dehydrogenase-like flavoprotein